MSGGAASELDGNPADACIIVGDTITVAPNTVIGSRPLVIVAQTQINVTTVLNAASRRSKSVIGAGSGVALDCKPFASSPGIGPPGGGGSGESFMFPGGNGGNGDGTNPPGGQAANGIVDAPARLRGGCAGQERVTIVARTKAGLERARRLGVRLGRPPRTIDVQRARALISGGLSLRQVAKRLRVPPMTLHGALHRTEKGSPKTGG